MPMLRAQVVHRHRNGLPRDNFINTFHFSADTIDGATANAVAEHVRNAYTGQNLGEASPLWNFFGDQVAITGHEVRIYPIDPVTGANLSGEGAPPIHVEQFDHVGRTTGQWGSVPSEIAACVSFVADAPTSVPIRRRRGRVYLGPWRLDRLAEEAGTERSYITSGYRTTLVRFGQFVRDINVIGVNFVVWSRPFEGRGEVVRPGRTTLPAIAARPGAMYEVTRVFADDAFDVQRRRGERPAARTWG